MTGNPWWQADGEHTGPVSGELVAGGPDTGPVPTARDEDPGSTTAPHRVLPQPSPFAQHNRVFRRGPLRPLSTARPPRAAGGQRPLSRGDRAAVAFVLHQFPIGHMPVAASRPSHQLPPPPPEHDRPGGSRIPPQDHPRSAAVDGADALERIRTGEAHTGTARARVRPSADHRRLPAELSAGHDPLGGLNELEWAARYLTRAGARDEHAWPAGEGGSEAVPVVLGPDAVLDHLGSGEGRVLAAEATPFPQRSLPVEHLDRDHRRYRVLRPLPAWRSVSAPWFGQPGGGIRYRTTHPLVELVALGHLVELSRDRQLAEAGTLRLRQPGPTAGTTGEVP